MQTPRETILLLVYDAGIKFWATAAKVPDTPKPLRLKAFVTSQPKKYVMGLIPINYQRNKSVVVDLPA